jgi:hypothetical protein
MGRLRIIILALCRALRLHYMMSIKHGLRMAEGVHDGHT